MENEPIFAHLYCVGITPNALIMQMKHKNIHFCRIKWGSLSACMTSSFFEYHVRMREELVGNEHYYHITDWISVKLRIDPEKEVTLGTYIHHLKKIIKQNFFVLLQRETTTTSLDVKDYFSWDIHCKGLSTSYITNFSLEDEILINTENQLTVAQYWSKFDDQYGEYIDSVTHRFHPTKENTEQNDLRSIFRLLNEWWSQPHIYGYFKNHLLDMEALHYLCQYNDNLQISLSNQPTGVIHDLHNLHLQLRDISQEKEINLNIHYYDIASLFQFTLRDKLNNLLNYYFEDVSSQKKREQIMNAIIVPQLMAAFEKRASQDASTCYPISLKSILFYYNRLFSIPFTEEDYASILPFNLNTIDLQESCTLFTKDHYAELIRHISNHIKRFNRSLKWYQLYKDDDDDGDGNIILKSTKINLFIIASRPHELEEERECHQLMMNKNDWIKELHSVTPPMSDTWQVEEWNQSFRQLDDIDRSLYHLRVLFLQFNPISYRKTIDLEKMKDILFNDLYTTSIIRPITHNYTHKRLLLYFNQYRKIVSLDEIKQHIYNIGDDNALKDTCIIPDAHLYSNYDMLILLRWLYAGKTRINRIVFISTIDIIPLHNHGHAFLNLLYYHNESEVRLPAFRFTDLANQFCSFIDTKMNSIHQFSRLTGLQQLLSNHFKNGKSLKLHLIVMPNTLKYKIHPFEDAIRENLDLKFVGAYGLQIDRITIGQLALNDTMIDYNRYTHIYMVRQEDLIHMNRNAWYHLLLMVEQVFILTSSGISNLKWLKKEAIQSTIPNLRYTFPFFLDKVIKNQEK